MGFGVKGRGRLVVWEREAGGEGEEGSSGASPGELQTAVTQHALTQQGLEEGLLLGSRGQHTHTRACTHMHTCTHRHKHTHQALTLSLQSQLTL